MLFLEVFLLLFAHLHHGAHVDLIEGRKHRRLVFHFDELARDDAAELCHFLARLSR